MRQTPRRKRDPLPYTVTGPATEKALTSYGAACAFALDHASRTGTTFYVRSYGDIVARAEGAEDGSAVLRERAA